MKNSKLYIGAAVCVVLGIALTGGGIAAGGWPGISIGSDGIRMSGEDQKEDYILEKIKLEEFSSAEIDLDYGNFYLIPSDGYYLEYRLGGKGKEPEYAVNNDSFLFEERPGNNCVHFSIMSFEIPKVHEEYYVKLYVPEEVYFESFVLNQGNGNTEIGNLKGNSIEMYLDYGTLTADLVDGEQVRLILEDGDIDTGKLEGKQKLEITMSSGDLETENLETGVLDIENSYGNVKIESLTANESGEISLDYGNLTIGKCITGNMDILLSYGKLTMQEVSGKSLLVENSYGDVEVNSLLLEKKGNFILESGNAEVAVQDEISDYTMKLDTEYGKIHAPDIGNLTKEGGEQYYRLNGVKEKELEIYCSSGDIAVSAKDEE